MPLAWSYLRTSSVRQAQADRSGMERQEQALARWLAEHPDYVLQEALVDAGVSAGKGKNRRSGALARFIEGGRSGAVPPGSCLVVESMSRFSREIATTTLRTLLNNVWGAGLAISFCTDGAVLDEELIAREDHRLHAILGAIGQARREWEERSRRSSGAAQKARRAQDEGARTPGPTPWWISRDPTGQLLRDETGALQLDPVAAATIRMAAQLAIDGLGCKLIADRLNEAGRPAPWKRSRGRQPGDRWTFSQVANLLRQEAITGVLTRKDGTRLPGYYAPVLTPQEWAQLRAAMEQRHRAKGRLRSPSPLVHNLFQGGAARCAICRGPFTYHPPSARARVGHPGWLGCREGNRREGGRCSNRGLIDYGQFESHALTRLSLTDWEALLRRPEDDADRTQLEQQVAQLQSERGRLAAQLEGAQRRAEEAWLAGAPEERQATIERVMARLRTQLAQVGEHLGEAEQQLAVIRSRPSAADAAAELVARVRSFWDALPTATPAERLAFCRWVLSRQIEFRIHPRQIGGGDRLVSLLVQGKLVSMVPLAGHARQLAREQGMVDPAAAVQERLPDGSTVVVLFPAKDQQQGEGEASPAPQPDPAPTATRLIDDGDGGVLIVQDPV